MTIKIVGGDAETFYDQTNKYGLRSMTTQEYIEHEQFQVIGWSIGELHGDYPVWEAGRADKLLSTVDWANTAFVAHNNKFDGSILDEHYGIRPKYQLCTMAMARTLGIGKLTGSVSLANLAKFFCLPDKGDEVIYADGKRLEHFRPAELRQYGAYCCNDTDLMLRMFKIMSKYIDGEELMWHSMVHKAYTEPACVLNLGVLQKEKQRVLERDAAILDITAEMFSMTVPELVKLIRGRKAFPELLEELGVIVPLKTSPSTGKPTYALSKTDVGFTDLLEHANPKVAALVQAKLGAGSNAEITRLDRMIALAKLGSNKLRMPLRISGAHTHRASGEDKMNTQNWASGRVEGQSTALRRSVEPVPGKLITAPDSGQIEARVLAFLANDQELLGLFQRGECPYSAQASVIYNLPADEIYAGAKAYGRGEKQHFDKYIMRQTGKAAILQLGYQAGQKGFYTSLTGTYGVTDATQSECANIVDVYRDSRPKVVEFWAACEKAIRAMKRGEEGYFGGLDDKLFYYNGKQEWFGELVPSIKLPNNTWLTFPDLQDVKADDDWRSQTIYIKDRLKFKRALAKNDRTRKEILLKQGIRLYGGKLTENLCQAVAFAALKWQGIRMTDFGSFVGNVHDEHLFIIDQPSKAKELQKVMTLTPPYLKGVVFDCEYEVSDNYADC